MTFRKIAKLLYCYIADNKKNNLTIQQYNNYKSRRGFTLIELMVAISITAVLGTLSIAGFVNYNQAQVLQTSANEVVTMLNLAKSRAQSQIKPSLCTGDIQKYIVDISATNSTYALGAVCNSGSPTPEAKTLPTGVSFSENKTFFFPVQTGGVQESGVIVISNSKGKTKSITVNSLGGVSIQ